MDELLEMLKKFPNGELMFTYNTSTNTFEITASCGRFFRTVNMADSDKLDKGTTVAVIAMRAIRLTKEKMQEAADARRNQALGVSKASGSSD